MAKARTKYPLVSMYKPSGRARATDPWLIAYTTDGKRQVLRASAHQRVTEDLARRLSEMLDRVRLNLASPDELRHLLQIPRPLSEHLDDYRKHLMSTRTKKHADQMHDYARDALAGFENVGQIVSSAVQQKISELKHSGATKNRYIDAIHAFLKWGANDHRWPHDRARLSLNRFFHESALRRVLSLEQIADLIDAASKGGIAENVSGAVRSLIYRTVLASGLRANELRQLDCGDVRQHGIIVRGASAKNRKGAFLFLPPSLMKELHEHVAGRDPSEKVFEIAENTARMLKVDLAAAGIPYTTRDGVFDFHALRHMCGSLLASAGVPIKAVQVHMRHASIRMTMDTYGHVYDTDRARTVGAVDRTLQRLAQRDFQTVSEVYSMQTPETDPKHWSDGESNPDLLNAIQQQPALITIKNSRLRSRRNREVAPGAAQRLLAKAFGSVLRRRGGRR